MLIITIIRVAIILSFTLLIVHAIVDIYVVKNILLRLKKLESRVSEIESHRSDSIDKPGTDDNGDNNHNHRSEKERK